MKYINDIVANGNIYKGLKNGKGKTLEQLLQEQAVYLQELIYYYIRDYRKAYNKPRYKRQGDLEKSVSISDVKYVGGIPTIYVYFNENAVHRSGYGVWAVKDGRGKFDDDIKDFENSQSVNVAALINNGYSVQKPAWFKDLPNFGQRDGNGFINKAIEEFNKTNSLGIVVNINSDIKNTRLW